MGVARETQKPVPRNPTEPGQGRHQFGESVRDVCPVGSASHLSSSANDRFSPRQAGSLPPPTHGASILYPPLTWQELNERINSAPVPTIDRRNLRNCENRLVALSGPFSPGDQELMKYAPEHPDPPQLSFYRTSPPGEEPLKYDASSRDCRHHASPPKSNPHRSWAEAPARTVRSWRNPPVPQLTSSHTLAESSPVVPASNPEGCPIL